MTMNYLDRQLFDHSGRHRERQEQHLLLLDDVMIVSGGKCSQPASKLYSVRVLVAFLSLLGTAIMYITRVNLNIAILAMVSVPTESMQQSLQSAGQSFTPEVPPFTCPSPRTFPSNAGGSGDSILNATLISNVLPLTASSLQVPNGAEFNWTPPEQGIILGSFFYGYIVTQIIGGRLAESYSSPTKLIFLALSGSGVINLVTPYLARTTLVGFVLSRIVLGAVQGVVYPAFYCLFARWIPAQERSTFIPWLDGGITIGTILISATSGQLIVLFSQLGGWPVVFYFSGVLALVWSAFWLALVRSEPEDHPLISEQELTLIVNSHQSECSLASVTPSWRHILTSSVFYAVLLAKISYGVVFDFVTSRIPAYLQNVIRLPVDEIGLALAFIMTGYAFTLLTGGVVADALLTRSRLGKCRVRKLFQLLSGLIMAGSLFCIPHVGCSAWANVLLLAVCMLGYGFTSGGDIPIVADIAGPLSGTVFALMNTLCSVSGFAVPYIVGVVIESAPNSFLLWSSLLNSCVILVVLGTVAFIWLASSQFQSDWAEQDHYYQNIEQMQSSLDLTEPPSEAKMKLHSNAGVQLEYNTFSTIALVT